MKNNLSFYEKGNIEILYSNSSHCFPTHSHSCFCIGIVLDGEVTFNINNSEQLLTKSMLFLIPSNTPVKITTDSRYKYITVCIKNSLRDKLSVFNFSSYFINLNNCEEFTSICNKYKDDNNEDVFLNSIMNIIKPVISYKSTSEKAEDDIISNVCRYIIAHADEKFSLDKLAEEFYISKFYLIRLFKKKMGITPSQYHTQAKLRILKAEVLKNKSETSIAIDLNLCDQSHLCRLFRKYMGISIQSYKRNYNSN